MTTQSTSQCEYSLENELKLDSIELDDPSVLHIYGYDFMKVPFDVISSTAFQAEEEYIIFVAQFSTTLWNEKNKLFHIFIENRRINIQAILGKDQTNSCLQLWYRAIYLLIKMLWRLCGG